MDMISSNNSKLLSIIIPVYNRQKSLDVLLSKLCHAIIENKVENDIEIIVIDDFSSPKIIIPKLTLPIVHLRNNVNNGAPLSRKNGYKQSKGEFVHFHDSDDWKSEVWLKGILKVLIQKSEIDLVLTARMDVDDDKTTYKLQKFFHKHFLNPRKIKKRLIYRNCMGPLGGVIFSRRVLNDLDFNDVASCQDWQMYLHAIEKAKLLCSLSETTFFFDKTGDDRISHNPRKKILGHLQLAKITSKQSVFDRNIRLFYLYTCKQHIYNKGGSILTFYKKNRIKIFVTFLMISLYWRLT